MKRNQLASKVGGAKVHLVVPASDFLPSDEVLADRKRERERKGAGECNRAEPTNEPVTEWPIDRTKVGGSDFGVKQSLGWWSLM